MEQTFQFTLHDKDAGSAMRATRDHDVIRTWALRMQAQPATGQATSSGPATVDVHDGGSGLRFNFPGASRFRAIDWDEWFTHFDRHHLVFVYSDSLNTRLASRAYELWQRRGASDGHDLEDWFSAERQLRDESIMAETDARYRIVKDEQG
jgi:hypothetical protein